MTIIDHGNRSTEAVRGTAVDSFSGGMVKADAPNNSPQEEGSLNLEELEKTAVGRALERTGFNISHAAQLLGITRAALYRRMNKYGF